LEANESFRKDRGEHDMIAREWTAKYATAENNVSEVNIDELSR